MIEPLAKVNASSLEVHIQHCPSCKSSDYALFEAHQLSASEEVKLVEQLSRYRQIKEVYLVRKVVQYFPEKPLYILGVAGLIWLLVTAQGIT